MSPRQSPHTERLLDMDELGERIKRSRRWLQRSWRTYESLRRNVVRQGAGGQLFWPDDVVGKYVDEQRRRNRDAEPETPDFVNRKGTSK